MTIFRRAVVIVVDRLGAGFLGPYGNTWLDTPAFNQFAAESLLFENVLTDSPRLEEVYRSYWHGDHALRSTAENAGQNLLARLAAAGVATMLLTDETLVAEHAGAAAFGQKIFVPSRSAATANDVAQTQLAELFAAAIDQLHTDSPPGLLWVHARGLSGAWDAPLEFRQRFADEDDPPPPEFVDPPELRLEPGYDPDTLLGVVHAYAGQVAALDRCVGKFLDTLADSPHARETLVVFTSPRGFPLGEHLRVGPCDEALYSELLHVPLLLRFPDGRDAAVREQGLVQPADLYATLAAGFGLPATAAMPWGQNLLAATESAVPAATPPLRQIVGARHGSQRAIRTPSWFLRSTPERHELFFKPDDRCEVNEVANRREDIVEQLTAAGDQFELAAQSGDPHLLPPLPESLLHAAD